MWFLRYPSQCFYSTASRVRSIPVTWASGCTVRFPTRNVCCSWKGATVHSGKNPTRSTKRSLHLLSRLSTATRELRGKLFTLATGATFSSCGAFNLGFWFIFDKMRGLCSVRTPTERLFHNQGRETNSGYLLHAPFVSRMTIILVSLNVNSARAAYRARMQHGTSPIDV